MSMHERPFDFWVPALPEHPPSSALELIPFDLMMRHCRAGMDWQLALVRAVQCHSNLPIFHIEAPPPVENSEMMERHARMHAPTWGKMQKFGSTSASFRFKVWWAWTAAAREWCTRLGIHFITAPEETRDSLGFLQRRYFADGIHGNDEYGRLMVHQVEKAKQRFGVGQSADG
jgi:hypothetical protein